jgi:putative flippase GtrA
LKVVATQPVKFVLVGMANTLVGLAAIYAIKFFFRLDDVPANLLGYMAGFCVSYVLNAKWTFAYSGSLSARLPHYLLLAAIAYGVNLAVVTAVLYGLNWNSYLAQACGVLPYTAINYFGSKWVVFRRENAVVAPSS